MKIPQPALLRRSLTTATTAASHTSPLAPAAVGVFATTSSFRPTIATTITTTTTKTTSLLLPNHALHSRRLSFSTSARLRAEAEGGGGLGKPVNIPKWVEENSHMLKPPVNNYCVWNEGYAVMIVGGPNARTDYHINQTPEWFYQYRGSMLLKTVNPSTNTFQDIIINEGDMFYLPPNTPHNPVRFANTVGIVLEQQRPSNSVDKLRWYCQNCKEQVHEKSFHCTDLGTQIKKAVNEFMEDEKARTCKTCGEVCDVRPKANVEAISKAAKN